MYAASAFDVESPQARFRLTPGGPADVAGAAVSDLSSMHNPSLELQNAAGHLSPENPLLWVFGIFALTVGLASLSTHVKVGPVKAGLDLGKGA